jgi:cell division protein FtsW
MDTHIIVLGGLSVCILLIILWEICFGYKDFIKNKRALAIEAPKKNWPVKIYAFFLTILGLSVILYGMFQIHQNSTPLLHILTQGFDDFDRLNPAPQTTQPFGVPSQSLPRSIGAQDRASSKGKGHESSQDLNEPSLSSFASLRTQGQALKKVIHLSKTQPVLIGNASEIDASDTTPVVLRGQGIAKRHARIKYDLNKNAWEIEKLDRNPVVIKRVNEEIHLGEMAEVGSRKAKGEEGQNGKTARWQDGNCPPAPLPPCPLASLSLILMNNDKISIGDAILQIEIPSLFGFSTQNGFLLGMIFAAVCLVTLVFIINKIHSYNYFLFPVVILLSGLGLIMMYKLSQISTDQLVLFHFTKLISGLFALLIVVQIPNKVWYFFGRPFLAVVTFPYRLVIAIHNRLSRKRYQKKSFSYAGENDKFLSVSYSQRANPYSMAHYLFVASMVLLLLPIVFGGRLGINLGFMRIQPAEFAKIILIYYFTSLICIYLIKADNLDTIFKRFRLVSPILIMMILPAVTLAALHDFGPILLLYAIILILFYIGSSRVLEPVTTTIFLLCTCALFLIFKPNSIVFIVYFSLLMLFLLINPHLRILGLLSFFGFISLESGIYYGVIRPEHFQVITERLEIWENPWGADKGLQLARSLWLIRDSGWLGDGFNWNSLSILPPAFHTDFIFSVIAATFGFAGAIFIFICYLLIAYAGLKIVAHSFSSISGGMKRSMLIAGIVFSIGFQAFVIIAGNLKILPLTGITLPLLSYGGSSLLATFILVGLMYK